MLDREPFLRAIFDDPANDLPKLVFADYLDDRGEGELAAAIRVEREYLRTLESAGVFRLIECLDRRAELLAVAAEAGGTTTQALATVVRGLFRPEPLEVDAATLADAEAFRLRACEREFQWFGATRLVVTGGIITTPAPLETILTSPVTERVTELVLSGREVQMGRARDEVLGIGLIDYVHKPVVTPRMVEHLCGMREVRRLVALDLTRNDLDNDALRALARTKKFLRLKELHLSDGNSRVRGGVWSQVLDNFGPGVVS
jgi:uncharacterized protein (TIGR02996 family)